MSTMTLPDLESLLKAVAWISHAEVAFFAKRFPQAVSWTTIWAELRQSYCSTATDETKHRTAIVLCWRNGRTKKMKERVLFAGSGDCPICTANDLLTQLKAELPAAFEADGEEISPHVEAPREIRIHVPHLGRAFPVGIFGTHVVGQS